MIFHPSESRLNEFADGELNRRPRIRTAAHLEGCSRCRNTIVAVRRLSREARVLPSPNVPAGLKDRILERLANGERVILPVADPPTPARTGRRVAAAFAATAAAAMLLTVVRVPELASESSELTWFPQQVEMGGELTFEYRATSMFAGEDTLTLRGLYRTAADGSSWHQNLPNQTIGALVDDGSGIHRLSIKLPDDVVYGVFVVEDSEGNQVDSRGRAFWKLLVYEDGNPSYDALLQEVHDLTLRDWEGAYKTARELVDLYPNKPGARFVLGSLESELFGGGFDLLTLETHRNAFARIEGQFDNGVAFSSDDIGDMYGYARLLGDVTAADRWRERMLREAPDHYFVKQIRVSDAIVSAGGEWSDATKARLENLWNAGGFEMTSLTEEAYPLALAGDDADAMVRWLDRLRETQPAQANNIARSIAMTPGGRRVGIGRLEILYDFLGEPHQVPRSLYHTWSDHQVHTEDRRQAIAGVLGGALVEEGEISDGLRYLTSALNATWDVELFAQAAGVLFGLGRTNEAFQQWARVAVDPWPEQSVADSLETRAREVIRADEWDVMLETARLDMAAHYIERLSHPQRIDLNVEVQGSDGSLSSVGELMSGRVSVFAFWSRNDYHDLLRKDSLAAIYRRIDTYDGALITVVQEQRSPEWEEYEADDDFPPYPIYHDIAGEVHRDFDVWYSTYFVVDAEGVVQFAYSEIGDALRQVAALHRRAQQAATPVVTEEADRPQ